MSARGSIRAPLLSRTCIAMPHHVDRSTRNQLYQNGAASYACRPELESSIRLRLQRVRIQMKPFHSNAQRLSASSSAIPHISLHIAASSSGKGRKFRSETSTFDYQAGVTSALGLQNGKNIYEKRRKRPDSGQDAYFVAKVGQEENITAFGIADGVGGWTDHGVDPADFSHGMCSYMAQIALDWSGEKLGPQKLLEMAYRRTVEDPEISAGGTTACVAVTDKDGRMRSANLGDSGFLQLRLGTVHHYSNPQTHAFNTPYQMSLTPPDILAQASLFGGMPLNDNPERADLADHMLRHGDVLILATDGVWDNLDSQDVLKTVSQIMRDSGAWQRTQDQGYCVGGKIFELTQQKQVQNLNLSGTLQYVLSAAIVGEAKAASLSTKRDGPFAKAVKKEYPYDPYHGGKVDDISVLVVIPVDETHSEQQMKAKL